MSNYCHHLTAAGTFCRGIPMKKRDYCFWHLNETGRRMKAARARSHSERVTIQLPVLDDLHAVQVGLMQLGEAIVHGEIDDRRGRLLLAVLRLAASNIKAQGAWLDDAQMHDWNDTAYASENPEFEAQYGLPKGFDLSVDPQVAFPPPEQTPGGPHIPGVGICGNEDDLRLRFTQILHASAAPIPGTDFHATADDMELMDVYQHQGQQAGLQRAAELERSRKRRERRERRTHYEEMARNRNIQLAAEKLLADQSRQEAARQDSTAAAEAPANRKPPQTESGSPSNAKAEIGVA